MRYELLLSRQSALMYDELISLLLPATAVNALQVYVSTGGAIERVLGGGAGPRHVASYLDAVKVTHPGHGDGGGGDSVTPGLAMVNTRNTT